MRQGQRAIWRDVTLGISGRDVVEVLAGLEPGDWMVASANAKNPAIAGRRISAP